MKGKVSSTAALPLVRRSSTPLSQAVFFWPLHTEMADKGDVDFDGLELIDMRLEIDVDTLVTYMEENSEFPGMTS